MQLYGFCGIWLHHVTLIALGAFIAACYGEGFESRLRNSLMTVKTLRCCNILAFDQVVFISKRKGQTSMHKSLFSRSNLSKRAVKATMSKYVTICML